MCCDLVLQENKKTAFGVDKKTAEMVILPIQKVSNLRKELIKRNKRSEKEISILLFEEEAMVKNIDQFIL